MLTLSAKPQMWYFHVVVLQRMTRNYAKERAARAARLFFYHSTNQILYL